MLDYIMLDSENWLVLLLCFIDYRFFLVT